jgi:hypothetical protein
MKKLILSLLLTFLLNNLFSQIEYKDVAGIFYARCTSCHHEGASNFPFMNYTQTSGVASLIQNDLTLGTMPPWNADTSYTRFMHERIITAPEKQKILSWIANGTPAGDTTLAPMAPHYTNGFQLAGNADLTLSIGTFTSTATSSDKYYCFSLPTGLIQDRIIRAFEVVPGNHAIVHHAVVTADTNGTYNSNLSGSCFNIPGNLGIGTYAPGTRATIFPSQAPLKAGIRLKSGSKIIIQLHYPAGSSGMVDSTKIRLYFYPPGETGIRTIYSNTPLQNWSFYVMPNTISSAEAYYPGSGTLSSPLSLLAVYPHNHMLGRQIINYAVKPGVDTIKLIRINEWDFEWQDYYLYKRPVKVPNGYRLYSKHIYDNTINNPNNPNNPPALVTAGTGTNDEMLFDGAMYMNYLTGDENIDVENIINNDPLLAVGIPKQENNIQISGAKVFPNPFNNSTFIQFSVFEPTDIEIEIFDILGNKIISKEFKNLKNGYHDWEWKGDDLKGNKIESGLYIYKIISGKEKLHGKIIKE